MFDGAGEALGYVLTQRGLFLVIFGTLIGTVAAILPGVSPVTMMALLLPLIFDMDKYEAFIFLASLMAAGGFAGSMTSILLNVPGDGINAATCLDGFPLARQGKAGMAIGASAAASGLGALFGLGLLVLSLPFIRNLILVFSPPEFFAMSIAGIALIGTVSARAPLKGLAAGLLGMALGLVGMSLALGGSRFTFGLLQLEDGISLIPALIGLFALPELVQLLRHNESVSSTGYTVKGGVWEGVMAVLTRPKLFFRSAAIGTLLGLIPGVGASVSSWVSYFAAQSSSKDPKSFGKGNIEGVIAPEATIDAKEGASMMPVLAIGLPAGVSTAVLLSAFQIKGIFPGQALFRNDMPLVWVLILAMVFSNLSTSLLGLLFANVMVKLTVVPAVIIAPIVVVLGAVGSYADQQSMFGILLMLLFGLLGVGMVRLGYPRSPLLVGMILLPLAEDNFLVSLQMSRGSYEFLLRPLTLGILGIVLLALLFPLLRNYWAGRREAGRLATIAQAVEDDEDEEEGTPRLTLEHVLFPLGLLVLTLVLLLQTGIYRPQARYFPYAVFIPLALLLGVLVVRAARTWWEERGTTPATPPPGQVGARPDWLIALWIVGIGVLMLVVGVIPAVGLYTAGFILWFAPQAFSVRRATLAVAAGLGVTAATYYIFVTQLGMSFYPGLFLN